MRDLLEIAIAMEKVKKRKKGVIYSVNSWDENFYCHTNDNAEDFKIG